MHYTNLVDEYQDTNYIQFLLVKRFAEPQNNICVVGDDAQSIYSFRGADIRNILNFRQVYPQARLFKLEQNYRSTQNIVNAANSLIHKNINQIEKTVYSKKEQGQPLTLQAYMDDRTEALGVATHIQKMRHKGYNSFAVLYRILFNIFTPLSSRTEISSYFSRRETTMKKVAVNAT